ncbi:GtrA family protein [Roseovarius rhodophyticola]|uniref:GtrA family protein n=1 Tax=Roseovarius rhodophyticola TaxID=3080827 RepID=A0ABZ2TK60_9RHOB|nr:GtrA family protein [Roseovarius sp. W115]MDV2928391.1 GtrA family protein [Roseovarius sp. W115]
MIKQLSRFAGIGALATLLHVTVALIVAEGFGADPQLSNLTGFLTAVGFSYFGHGHFTFSTELKHRVHGTRFLSVSVLGLCVSSGLTYAITDIAGLPFLAAMGVVAVAVPLSTFVLCKLWVFHDPQRDGP